MTVYLDTNVCVYLVTGDMRRVSQRAILTLEAADLLVSPMVLLEIDYLHEVGRLTWDSDGALSKLTAEIGVQVCDLPFVQIIRAAAREDWTRDTFDRIIVSHAKANGMAKLVTSDRDIRQNYSRAVW